MRVRGIHLLETFHRQGRVTWEDGVPGVLVPNDPDVARMVREDLRTIQAVLRRAAAFRRQLSAPSPDPFVRFREPRWCPPGTCPCCGAKIGEHEFLRCGLCALAVEITLAGPER